MWHAANNKLELEFDKDENDITLYGSEEDLAKDETSRKKKADEGIKRCHAYKHSLRAYVSILYLKWPKVIINLITI